MSISFDQIEASAGPGGELNEAGTAWNNFTPVSELWQQADELAMNDEQTSEPPEALAEKAAEALCRRARSAEGLAEEWEGLKLAADYLELAWAVQRKKGRPYRETALKLAALYLSLEVRFNDRQALERGRALMEQLGPEHPDDPLFLFWRSHYQFVVGDRAKAREYYDRAQLLSREEPPNLPIHSFHRCPASLADMVEQWPAAKNLYQWTQDFIQSNPSLCLEPGPAMSKAEFQLLAGLSRPDRRAGDSPYRQVAPESGFWKTAVAVRQPKFLADFYRPRFALDQQTKIMSAGSCFAQHISRLLKAGGFTFLDYEPGFKKAHYYTDPPGRDLGYDLYSARYGNIYTARQLRQLFQRAFGRFKPRERFWENEGRYYDAFRPTIEPGGFFSLAEAEASQARHLEAVRRLFSEAEVLIFTLGLTESWQNIDDGSIYPLCPGTRGGTFDPKRYAFKNFNHDEVTADLEGFFQEARQVNPGLKFLLTVSPVPLAATAGGGHVLPATMMSKAILRAAAATLYDRHDFVDYFPSYDLICSTPFASHAFEADMRTVKAEVVNYVMTRFFLGHGYKVEPPPAPAPSGPRQVLRSAEDEQCDEALLEDYAK